MVGFVLFLSAFATMGIAWFGVVMGYVLRAGGFERLLSLPLSEFILIGAGLFCPIIVLALGVAFVYLALELRKTQFLLNMYIRKVSGTAKTAAETPVEKKMPSLALSEMKPGEDEPEAILHERPVLNISTQERIDKYTDTSLPDNLDLHLVDKT